MAYKSSARFITAFVIPFITVLFFISCTGKEKSNTENTFYIELVNFTHDSLRNKVSDNIFGKVSYYKNKKLEIVSLNYVTDDYPDMLYFNDAGSLVKNVKPGTKKIRIEFGGTYSADSISYSLQKFLYNNNKWNKISDMGFIQATNTYKKAKQFAISEFGKQIVNSAVVYAYNR